MAAMSTDFPRPDLTLTLKQEYAYQILAGNKEYESRHLKGNGKLANLQPGQVVSFHWYTSERVMAQVSEILKFESLQAMLAEIHPSKFLPSGNFSIAEASEARIMRVQGLCTSLSVVIGSFHCAR